MTPIFNMMIGLPASGKSTDAKYLAGLYGYELISSDDIRQEFFGDINDVVHTQEVFDIMESRTKLALRQHRSVVYDATNISYKRRKAFLEKLKGIDCIKVAQFVSVPYEVCLKRNADRERHVPESVIKRMYKNFDVPYYYEGWDSIKVLQNEDIQKTDPETFVANVLDFNQDNPNHKSTLGYHLIKTMVEVPNEMCVTALLHDCGKPFTKTFIDKKGNETKTAHYYNHEKTGAYDSLFFNGGNLDIAAIIRWHMMPYMWEKETKTVREKMENKYRTLWGEELYQKVMVLHQADKLAH